MLDTILIGKRIRELRQERGLTQSAFAEKLCVSFQAVSNWERGIAPPELENLIRIAAFFDILVDDLLRQRHEEKLFLGIDGGGTKTEFAVVSLSGRVLYSFRLGGVNPNDIGSERSVSLLADGIRDVLLKFPSVCSVFCGISGASTGNNAAVIEGALREKYPAISFKVKTDSSNLFAMSDSVDMAVISGTGSVVFVKQEERYIRIGGWGYLLGDRGSAYDIGREALRVALLEEDSLGSPSLLTSLLKERLGTKRVSDSLSLIYSEGKPFIASLASVVFRAYESGDKAAFAIISSATRGLAELLNTGITKYGAAPRAIAGGGIFEKYRDIMLSNIKRYTDTELILVGLPPIYGAARQAVLITESGICDEFFDNFKNTYGGTK